MAVWLGFVIFSSKFSAKFISESGNHIDASMLFLLFRVIFPLVAMTSEYSHIAFQKASGWLVDHRWSAEKFSIFSDVLLRFIAWIKAVTFAFLIRGSEGFHKGLLFIRSIVYLVLLLI